MVGFLWTLPVRSIVWLALWFAVFATTTRGQGVLNTEAGQGFVSRAVPFSYSREFELPVIQFRFGFTTDELVRAGMIPDAFTISIVDEAGDAVRILVTADAGGVVWAPVTPGTIPVVPDSIGYTPIPYSSLDPVQAPGLANSVAFDLQFALSAEWADRDLTVYFDLFNNDDDVASQAWYSQPIVVPEPSAAVLLGFGLGGLVLIARRARPGIRAITGWLAAGLLWSLSTTHAADTGEKVFRLNEVELTLAEVTPDTAVYFRSMRLNRALNVWNVEVTLSNRSDRLLNGPLVLLVDSHSGTPGPVGPDGLDDSQPPKGYYDLSARAGDGVLAPGETTEPRTLTLGRSGNTPPALQTRVFAARVPLASALTVTRSLDEVGRPLPGVALTVTGPAGTAQQVSDGISGVASIGQGEGEHQVVFRAQGHLPVWRRQALVSNRTAILPNPRLPLRDLHPVTVTPLGGSGITNASGSIRIEADAGAVAAATELTLSALSGQTLPGFLPLGWSPLSAFWLESSRPLSGPLRAALRPDGPIGPGETAALVRWDEAALLWRVAALVPGQGSNAVTVSIGSAGAYALVAPDTGPTAPPAPQGDAPLPATLVQAPALDGLTAEGAVTPPASPASLVPEEVTARADLTLRHASSAMPSGLLLRGEVTETYVTADGGLRLTPQYEQFLVGYQRPGDADPQTLHSSFPIRPRLLFGPDQLDAATVRMDLLSEQPFDGQVLDAAGGQIGAEGVRVLAGGGRLTGPSAFRLRRLDATVFTNLVGAGHTLVAAFDLTVDGSTVVGGLAAQLSGAPTNGLFVLARVLSDTGYFGLQPVERLQSEAAGQLTSLEPSVGERLPGLRGSGQFVLVRVDQPQGLVTGVARNGAGAIQEGMPVSVTGLPWLTLTDNAGRYQLVASAGQRELVVRDPVTGDAGLVTVTVADPGQGTSQDLGTAPRGPRVARMTPEANATRVPRVGSVVIEFDEAVNPATVVNAIQLLRPDNSAVPASVTLNLANRIATLSPSNELDANTAYRVQLAATIADPGGLPLEGSREFTFTTVPLSTRDVAAQLIIYEPGATNVPVAILDDIPAYEPGQDRSAIVVHGTPGVADAEVPVVLVNETTGETATVLSKPDGSFSSVIAGNEEDFVSAIFVNLNNTRIYVPVSRQEFDNGFVGLYPQGGILEAQSDGGPVRVIIEPKAIERKAKLRLKPVPPGQLAQLLGGVKPAAGMLAGAGLQVEVEEGQITGSMKARFPVDLHALGYATNAPFEPPAVALAMVRDTQDETSFEVLDQMIFTSNATLEKNAFSRAGDPAAGQIRRADGGQEQLFAGVLDSAIGFIPVVGGPAQMAFNFVVVPLIIGPRPVVIKGKTMGLPADLGEHFAGVDLVGMGIDVASGGQGASALSEYLKEKLSKPVSGAFVALETVAERDIGRPGRIKRGMVYATSGRDGSFLMVAPSLTNVYLITATSALYQDRQTVPVLTLFELSLAGAVFKNFFFDSPALTRVPPSTHVAHAPLEPAPGTDCEVQVNASSGGGGAPPQILVQVKSVTSRVPGVTATLQDAQLTLLEEVVLGTTRKRWRGSLKTDKNVIVRLRVGVLGANDQSETLDYPIAFGGLPPVTETNAIPSSDPNDPHGPVVIFTLPPDGGVVSENGTIRLRFDKAISRSVLESLSGINLNDTRVPPPVVRLSPDQKELVLQYAGLDPENSYTLSVSGLSVRDLNDKPLDQRPSTPALDSFSIRFTAAPIPTTAIPGIQNGRGSAISGNRLYALEMTTPSVSYLVVYDITNPGTPIELSRTSLFGPPRDLVVIPDYAYRLRPGDPVRRHELVVVVGGELDARIGGGSAPGPRPIGGEADVNVRGQYLWVFEMEDPRQPRIRASPVVSYRVGSAVVKVRWEAPYLTYQEFNPEYQHLGLVNLQELIRGYAATPAEAAGFDPQGASGKDTNNDGDYVDDGDELPTPQLKPIEFYGKHGGYFLNQTTQRVNDFDTMAGFVGVTLGPGFEFNDRGQVTKIAVPPSYRTVASGGGEVDFRQGSVRYDPGAHPKRVSLSYVPIQMGATVQQTLVAMVALAPDADGRTKLSVIDITLPAQPRELNRIVIPDELSGGQLQSVVPRRDGVLELATAGHVLELNPRFFGQTNYAGLHPSIIGFIPGAGGGTRSLGQEINGVHAVADGGHNVVVQTAPILSFVQFPELPAVVNPQSLPQGDESLRELFDKMLEVGGLVPARLRTEPELSKSNVISHLSPPLPAAHYHVLVRAPGLHEQVELGLEALNSAGRPVANKGFRFPPVRAVSLFTLNLLDQKLRPTCDAPIRSLPAYRVSNDPNSPFYNYYLSRPFALIYEDISLEEIAALKTELEREILWASDYWRAFIDPVERPRPVVGPFAARVDADRKALLPLASQTVRSFPASYVAGRNPPPAGGHSTLSGTFGTVSAHNGEVRMTTTDMTLPSRRLGIRVERSIGGQDNYDGPFGLGWDFNYNQRLTELEPDVFPVGLSMPLINRGTESASVIASGRDLIFHSGGGRMIHFRWVNDRIPSEYQSDPLVRELKYADSVAEYYLPEDGVFDLLVKFQDGKFERLTPDGTRFQYDTSGHLKSILDRFPANRHDLDYDSHGWLIRIDDRSVTTERYLEFGYYRWKNDPEFTKNLDEVAPNSFVVGKICRLRDYVGSKVAGRDVLFFYNDEGLLIRRESFQVDGENTGYAGRAKTHYLYDGCKIKGVGVGEKGTPLFVVDTAANSRGANVAKGGKGVVGDVGITIPMENTAGNVGSQTSVSILADGRITETQFDAYGYPVCTKVSGGDGGEAQVCQTQNRHGQITFVRTPEGRTETTTYDESNPIFRSRANVLTRTVDPGPLGGAAYTEQFSHDPRCNLLSGPQKNANGFTINYSLSTDGRSVRSIRRGDDLEETFEHNQYGQLMRHVDEEGIETGAEFDAATGYLAASLEGSRRTERRYGSDVASQLGLAASIQPPRGAVIQIQYNKALQETEHVRGDLIKRYAYDEQGRMVREVIRLGGGRVRETELTILPQGFVQSKRISGMDVNGSPENLEYTYTPDSVFRIASIRHPGGLEQTFEYNNRGDITKATLGDYAEEFIHDREGNVVEWRRGGVAVATTEYDGMSRPKRSIKLTGNRQYVTTRAYYPGGQLRIETVTDPVYGLVSEWSFPEIDALGRPTRQVVEGEEVSTTHRFEYGQRQGASIGPRQTVRRTWNAAGDQITYEDSLQTLTMTRDGNGNLETVERVEGSVSYQDRYAYDDLDHTTLVGDALGDLRLITARADGLPLRSANGRGHATLTEHSVLGELERTARADGMERRYRRDARRHVTREGDLDGGFTFEFDEKDRLRRRTLRNGAEILYGDFDSQNNPQQVTMPGGRQTFQYDLLGRPIAVNSEFEGTAYVSTAEYDALGRVRRSTYSQDGGAVNSTTTVYDKNGSLRESRFQENGVDFTVRYTHHADLSRKSIIYPSGPEVSEERDPGGRLIGVSDAGGLIYRVTDWTGIRQPSRISIGSSIRAVQNFDRRGRLTGTRYTRTSDGSVLAHLRYQYDAANNREIVQYLHRAGKADRFTYDNGERVQEASFGVLPLSAGGFTPPEFIRNYGYSSDGLDVLVSSHLSGPLGARAPPFAQSWSAHDRFLLPVRVNDFDRGPADPLGRVRRAELYVRDAGQAGLHPVAATLTHNGQENLIRVSRSDGVMVENTYQGSLLRSGRQILRNGVPTETRTYVYDSEGRLLEEYERTGEDSTVLMGRYYYFSGDVPVAADLRRDLNAALERYYYLTDSSGSVIAVADASGAVAERVRYDTFGQPLIELEDTAPPGVQRVETAGSGALLIQISEPVSPARVDPGPGGGIVRFAAPAFGLDAEVTFYAGQPETNVLGSLAIVPLADGGGGEMQLRFIPDGPSEGPMRLVIAAGVLQDEWGNLNPEIRLIFTNRAGGAGEVLVDTGARTAAQTAARSSLGSPFFFQGQYLDYDTGLFYLRARFLDPFSGMFLEPDPLGYQDGVNLYAALGNNPTSRRDPSGLAYDWTEFAQSDDWAAAAKAQPEVPSWSARGLQKQVETQWFLAQHTATRAPNRATPQFSVEEVAAPAEAVEAAPPKVFPTGAERRAAQQRASDELWLGNVEGYHVGNRYIEPSYDPQANANYRGSRRINLGLYDNVKKTSARNGGMNFLSHGTASADRHVDRVIEIAASSEPQRLKPQFVVNVQGWIGDTLEEKVNLAIMRGARGLPNPNDGSLDLRPLTLQHAPDFEFHPGIEKGFHLPNVAATDLNPGVTDREMFRMYRAGVLHRAVFVEGADGSKVVKGQSAFRWKLRKVKPFTW